MKQRYLSLDVLRGITVTFMCIVNNPGSWGKIFAPLRHAPWVGCTPTDLVYPFFIFCAGCAMAFSFSKYDGFSKEAVMKVIRRGLGIFLVGFLINLYPFFPLEPHDASASFWQNYGYWLANKRIMGVLQRIGLSYLIAGLLALWLRKPAKILGAIGVLMAVYTGGPSPGRSMWRCWARTMSITAIVLPTGRGPLSIRKASWVRSRAPARACWAS